MKESYKESLDADVILACKEIRDDEAIIYCRTGNKKASLAWSGRMDELTLCLLTMMKQYAEFYDIAVAATQLYEEKYG